MTILNNHLLVGTYEAWSLKGHLVLGQARGCSPRPTFCTYHDRLNVLPGPHIRQLTTCE